MIQKRVTTQNCASHNLTVLIGTAENPVSLETRVGQYETCICIYAKCGLSNRLETWSIRPQHHSHLVQK